MIMEVSVVSCMCVRVCLCVCLSLSVSVCLCVASVLPDPLYDVGMVVLEGKLPSW